MKLCMTVASKIPGMAGYSTRILEEARSLTRKGVEIYLITYKFSDEEHDYEEVDGIHVFRVKQYTFRKPWFRFLLDILVNPLNLSMKMLNVIVKNNVQMIYVRDPYIAYFVETLNKLTFRLPLVYEGILKHLDLIQFGRPHNSIYVKITNLIDKVALVQAERIRVTTTNLHKELSSRGVENNKMHLIPIGVDTTKFKQSPGNYFQPPYKGKQIILYVGSLDKWQGVDILLEAFQHVRREIPDSMLFIATADSHRKRMYKHITSKQEIRDYAAFVSVPHDHVNKVMSSSQVFVIPRPPSMFASMFTPIKLLEAMAVGVPIVASNVEGIREVATESGAFLVKPGDASELAKGIIKVLKNRKLAKKLAENGRRIVEEHYSIETVTEKLLNVYEELSKPR